MGKAAVMEARITEVTMVQQKPKYGNYAMMLLESCRKFYEDPENERAFQEWKKEREEAK